MGFDWRCPAVGCDYEAQTYVQLKGHIDGSRPQCEFHADLPPVKKWQFRQ